VIGSTLGSSTENKIGLPLWISSTNGTYNKFLYNNFYLYTPVIDSANINNDQVSVFFVGWQYSEPGPIGLVAVRAIATLKDVPSLVIRTNLDVLLLNDTCFDIWTDINKPHLYIDKFDGKDYLIVAVTGRCDAFYRIAIEADLTRSAFEVFPKDDIVGLNTDIFSTTYDKNSKQIFYAYKKYNSDDISLHSFNVSNLSPKPAVRILTVNDTSPVFAFDQNKNVLYMAAASHDHIYQIDSSNIKNDLGIAVLPIDLKLVASMLVVDDFLYLVTWEPNAQLARINLPQHFCKIFCGTNGYCAEGKSNLCLCAPGYKNPSDNTVGVIQCLPAHEVDVYKNVINERGLAITFGILFAVAFIAAAGGWVMWWRSRKVDYSSLNS